MAIAKPKAETSAEVLRAAARNGPRTFATAKTVVIVSGLKNQAPLIVATINSAIWPEIGGSIQLANGQLPDGHSGLLTVQLVSLMLDTDEPTIGVLCTPND